jgi:hypothetical protein
MSACRALRCSGQLRLAHRLCLSLVCLATPPPVVSWHHVPSASPDPTQALQEQLEERQAARKRGEVVGSPSALGVAAPAGSVDRSRSPSQRRLRPNATPSRARPSTGTPGVSPFAEPSIRSTSAGTFAKNVPPPSCVPPGSASKLAHRRPGGAVADGGAHAHSVPVRASTPSAPSRLRSAATVPRNSDSVAPFGGSALAMSRSPSASASRTKVLLPDPEARVLLLFAAVCSCRRGACRPRRMEVVAARKGASPFMPLTLCASQ